TRTMTTTMTNDPIGTVGWVGDAKSGFVRLIDQTRLPTEYVELDCRELPAVWEAIRSLRVRGAPAIGVAAAYGAVLGARSAGRGPVRKAGTPGRPSAAPSAPRRTTCAPVARRP